MRGAPARAAGLVLVGWLGLASDPGLALGGEVEGRVRIGIDGVALEQAGAVVVFLESIDGDAPTPGSALPTASIHQSGARFEPDFLAVAVGQTVEMPNDDVIYHNVFSYSRPNDFDLGLYAAGESHAVRFAHPGLVRIYCSIHDEMDGLIFVAPSRLYAMIDAEGYTTIVGRMSEIIIRGGMNITPREIEEEIAPMDGVAAVAVVGMPHPRLGEIACACVVRASSVLASRTLPNSSASTVSDKSVRSALWPVGATMRCPLLYG